MQAASGSLKSEDEDTLLAWVALVILAAEAAGVQPTSQQQPHSKLSQGDSEALTESERWAWGCQWGRCSVQSA